MDTFYMDETPTDLTLDLLEANHDDVLKVNHILFVLKKN